MKKFEIQYEKETGKNPKCVMDGVEVDDAYTPAYVKWLIKKIKNEVKHERTTYDIKSLMRSSDKTIRNTLISLFRRRKDKYTSLFEKLNFEKVRSKTETGSNMYIVGKWGDGYDEFYTITIHPDHIHFKARYHHSSDDKVIFRQRLCNGL